MEQTVCYIYAMAVSKTEWTKMNWHDRIAAVLKELNISLRELAARLNVSERTINYWQSHTKIPRDKYAKILRSWCVSEPFNDIKEEAYMAMHTMSADASHRLLENACTTGDPMMLSMAMHCIASKLAALITHTSKNPESLVIKFNALYGDVLTKIHITNATLDPGKYSEVTITAPIRGIEHNSFTLTVSNAESYNIVSAFAFHVSDKALITCAKRINSHLTIR